jgi:hypothetical protein
MAIALISCKKEVVLSEFKYSEKDLQVNCEDVNLDLLKEAVFSFEDDIATYFSNNGTKNLSQAYSRTVNLALYGRAKYNDIVSDHTIEIFNILKEDNDLWNLDNEIKSLNYNSKLVKCLADNLSNKELKTTFNALLSANSMSAKLFGEPLRRMSYFAVKDKNLATYIALDMYYAKLFDLDLNQEKEIKEVSNPEITK